MLTGITLWSTHGIWSLATTIGLDLLPLFIEFIILCLVKFGKDLGYTSLQHVGLLLIEISTEHAPASPAGAHVNGYFRNI